MPYEVQSRCSTCGEGDTFSIGHWPRDLGVFPCPTCQAFVNVAREQGTCPGCQAKPQPGELYDYAPVVPYYHGVGVDEESELPACLRCGEGSLSFEIASHYNVGRLGKHAGPGPPPWEGEEYLEKSIFVFALIAFCVEFELEPQELLGYFSLTLSPSADLEQRSVSLPIFMEIKNHLSSALMSGEVALSNDERLREEAIAGMPPELLELLGLGAERPAKKWWQFWK